jgi:hypothetical protein
MSEGDTQTPAQKLIGDFAPKLVSLTDDVLFGRHLGAQRTFTARSEPDYGRRADRQRQHRAASGASRPRARQRTERGGAQRGDHPPRLLCGLASGDVRGGCGEEAVRGLGEGWRVAPEHFAERHGFVVLIALGESIIAIGVGAGLQLVTRVIAGAALGIVVVSALWWLYFDVAAIFARTRLAQAPRSRARATRARRLQLPPSTAGRGRRLLRLRPRDDAPPPP